MAKKTGRRTGYDAAYSRDVGATNAPTEEEDGLTAPEALLLLEIQEAMGEVDRDLAQLIRSATIDLVAEQTGAL